MPRNLTKNFNFKKLILEKGKAISLITSSKNDICTNRFFLNKTVNKATEILRFIKN